jgi:hypothetical protein
MTVPHNLSQQLALRSFWLGVAHPTWSREDIRNLAAQQLADEAREERERRAREPRHTPAAQPKDAREALLSRIMSMWARLAASPPAPPAPASDHGARRMEVASASLPEPTTSTPRRRVARRFPRSSFHRLVETFTADEPEPSPPEPQQPTIRAEGSNAVLIPDESYSKRFQDIPTQNWRKSIQDNEANYAERRGHPPSSSRIVR